MLLPEMNVRRPKSKNFALKGGLNTEVAGIERPPGEMVQCKNYISAEGAYNGYQSLVGYERFNGKTAPSDVSLETVGDDWASGDDYSLYERITQGGFVFYCTQASGSGSNAPDSGTPGDNTWWIYEGLVAEVEEFEDRGREAARTAITVMPGYGKVRGIHTFNNQVFGWQNDLATPTTTDLFASSGSGWTQVAADSTEMSPNGVIKAITARLAEYPAASPNQEVMYWVDGVTEGFFYYTGSGNYYNVTAAQLPSGLAPVAIGIWENRLFLVYDGGHLFFSTLGDPSNWDASTGYAGEIFIGETITNIEPAAGALVIFTRSKIKVLRYGSTTDQFIFKMDDFSDNYGAYSGTVQNLYEQLYFCDDRGISGFITATETGGFQVKQISQKIEEIFLEIKTTIQDTVSDISKRRYYVFFANQDGTATSEGFCLTFNNDRLKGTGQIELKHKVEVASQGVSQTGGSLMFFGDQNGMIYQLEKGTSMDGETLDTYMVSGFYHYGSPGYWKHFERLQFEISCATNTDFTIGTVYEYGSPLLPNTNTHDETASGGSEVWGGGITWGTFTWGAGHLGRAVAYIQGYSTNMAVTVATSSKYKTEHTLHNIMTNYSMGDVRQ